MGVGDRPPLIALVAGPDPGHAFPAIAAARVLNRAGLRTVVYTGVRWREAAARSGVEVLELPGLAVQVGDDDSDAGAKLSVRAARIALELVPDLRRRGVSLVISDVITVGGGWAAQLAGIRWIELSPHPLYEASRGLPPIGSGLEAGRGWRGRLRDTVFRAATATSIREGSRQRRHAREQIGLSGSGEPDARFVATLPALEVARPDWPSNAHVIGPLFWEPTDDLFEIPAGAGPLVMIAPSTAATGAADLVAQTLTGLGRLGGGDDAGVRVRVVLSGLTFADADLDAMCRTAGIDRARVTAGLGRQDRLLAAGADLVVCGGGHGMLAKALVAGVPVVTVPGGGDQWELASRVQRLGAGITVRPVSAPVLTEAVATVLAEPAYRQRAREAADSLSWAADPVSLVERMLRTGPEGR